MTGQGRPAGGGRYHRPVLPEQTLQLLRVAPGGHYCDATLGGGGHAELILEQSAPDGQLLGIDRDREALAECRERLAPFAPRLTLHHGNFGDLPRILSELGWPRLDGLLVDLGVSSHQLDTAERGFSFAAAGPLDMRMDRTQDRTAARLLAELDEPALADVIFRYGEERRSRKLARAIKREQRAGRLRTTADLRSVVASVVGPPRRGQIDPATRTFQALRIAVNEELAALDALLDGVLDVLRPGGRVVAISFHSLEDRAVKRCFARLARPAAGRRPDELTVDGAASPPSLELLTPKPLRADERERRQNPRARSARLRAAERL